MLAAFSQFCSYLERVSGIVITEDKRYLVESRIMPIVKREKMGGLNELLSAVQSNHLLRDEVVQAMTINETYFFRDKAPFDLIADKLLPRLAKSLPQGDAIRIWCAAAATGQEPYSISMIFEERAALLDRRKVEILATDLSEAALQRARTGIYSDFELQRGLSPDRLKRHFLKDGTVYRIKPEIKQRVTFQQKNLLSDYTAVGRFDIIMCRNVLIYFSAQQKAEVIRRLCGCLRPGGYFMLGASEGLGGASVPLFADPDLKGCYSKTSEQGAIASQPDRGSRLTRA